MPAPWITDGHNPLCPLALLRSGLKQPPNTFMAACPSLKLRESEPQTQSRNPKLKVGTPNSKSEPQTQSRNPKIKVGTPNSKSEPQTQSRNPKHDIKTLYYFGVYKVYYFHTIILGFQIYKYFGVLKVYFLNTITLGFQYSQ